MPCTARSTLSTRRCIVLRYTVFNTCDVAGLRIQPLTVEHTFCILCAVLALGAMLCYAECHAMLCPVGNAVLCCACYRCHGGEYKMQHTFCMLDVTIGYVLSSLLRYGLLRYGVHATEEACDFEHRVQHNRCMMDVALRHALSATLCCAALRCAALRCAVLRMSQNRFTDVYARYYTPSACWMPAAQGSC